MKRSSIKWQTGLVRHKPISRVSRRKRHELYVRRTYCMPVVRERLEGICEARIPGVCTGQAVDGHEPLKQSRGGDPTNQAHVLHVCRACHEFTENHPRKSTRRGLLISAHQEPSKSEKQQ